MFGFTEYEMEVYQNKVQSFAIQEVAHSVVGSARFITPATQKGDKVTPDMGFIKLILTDIETIITLTGTAMAYEYAHLQAESDLLEDDVIHHLHTKYEGYVITQFVKYGVVFTNDVIAEIVGNIILELPYIYAEVLDGEDFSEEEFLEERLEAYNEYLDTNFYQDDEDLEDFDEDFEDDEDEDEDEEVELSEEDFDD